VPRRNVSLGRVEVELLRRVHAARDPRFTDPGRHAWTRRLLAHQVLAQRRGEPIPLPSEVAGWLAERAEQMLAALRAAGCTVEGDLADLQPPPGAGADTGVSTGEVTPAELIEAADWTIEQLHKVLAERGTGAARAAPSVGPGDGVPGVLELLEHIRAADTGQQPRAAAATR
jgi:hypothetical protein